MIRNVGEAILLSTIIVVTSLTQNYWYLLFAIMPFMTWTHIDSKMRDKNNNYYWQKDELQIQKMKQELRLLKKK